MLVLTRKLNESIVIGDREITIRIVDVRGGRVRLGIEAPLDVRIERVNATESLSCNKQHVELVVS